MRFYAVFILILIVGCGKTESLLSHGKSISHWLEQTKAADPKSRKKAAVALGHIGSADASAIPALVDLVRDTNSGVRAQAILCLLNLGPAARVAIPALESAKTDKDATVRSYATKALENIQK